MTISIKKNIQFLAVLMMTALMLFQFSGCDNDDEDPDPGGNGDGPNVQLDDGILVDGDGFTLYFFTRDVSGESACEGSCLSTWPAFHVSSIDAGTGLDEADFGTITRGDGDMQTTYKGWPLYYYASDNAAGQTNGEGVGNVWFVGKPDYSIMLANAQLVGNDGVNYTGDYEPGDGETQYFVDSFGRTLYAFINDTQDQNNYTEEDFSNNATWPIFHTDISSLPSTINADDFGTIDVFGESQLTYKGWPLYYFIGDENRGENKGVSVPTPGVWPVVNTSTDPAPEGEEPSEPTIGVAENETLGNILTDAEGMTLYFFSNDPNGESNCSGTCLDNWPRFYVEEIVLSEESSLDAGDFGITGEGENIQTTYKGWPLYYFAADAAAGETGGEGIGEIWYVAKPDYTVMIANQEVNEGEGAVKYFVDAEGNTLYIFTNDTEDVSNCTGSCVDNWPVFYLDSEVNLPSTISTEDFSSITRSDDDMQFTYQGQPLYYYAADGARGLTTGEGVGNVWFVAEP